LLRGERTFFVRS